VRRVEEEDVPLARVRLFQTRLELFFLPPQKNSWVNFGSGRAPRL
jgi:hypothetical protein